MTAPAAATNVWPTLPYPAWQETLDTVHMWTQIVGKTKLELAPFLNEWWNIGFSVTSRGLSTGIIPFGQRVFQVDFNFLEHRVDIAVSDGHACTFPLRPQAVADFYREFMGALQDLGIRADINTTPVEVEQRIPFELDHELAAYDSDAVTRWWRILVQVTRLLETYRTPFVGKSSPVFFFWGSFDLAETRFSGRRAPQREWPSRWMALAADQEAMTAGFWPGSGNMLEPAFYAFTYPEPPGSRATTIQPDAAYYHPDLGEFILPYEAVHTAPDPDRLILDFFHSAYTVGATLGGWDRATLERPDLLAHQRGARR